MDKEFCHYSPHGTPSDDLTKCECHFFRTDPIFNGLLRSDDGRFWCALHAPLGSKAATPQPNNQDHGSLAVTAAYYAARRGAKQIDFRRTNWPVSFDDNWIRKHLNNSDVELDFSGAVFAKGGVWKHTWKTLVFEAVKAMGSLQFHSILSVLNLENAEVNGDISIDQATSELRLSNTRVSGKLDIRNITGSSTLTLDHFQSNSIAIGAANNHSPIKLNASKLVVKDNLKIKAHVEHGKSGFNCELNSLRAEGKVEIKGDFLAFSIQDSLIHECIVEAKFNETVNFEGTVFVSQSKFRDSCFRDLTNFSGVSFGSDVDFRNVVFGGRTLFSKAAFEKTAVFKNVAFMHYLDFSDVVFEDHVTFHPSESSRRRVRSDKDTPRNSFRTANFDRARFKSWVDFKNRKFEGPLSFNGTWFSKAPNFHGCAFHQDTSFRGAQFFDVASRGATEAYRTLKLAMESARAKDEEARFYSLEQRSWRRHTNGSPVLRGVSWLYDFGADYGRSIGKPLGWTVALFALFSVIYWIILAGDSNGPASFCANLAASTDVPTPIEIAIRHMFTQIVRPFEALTLRAGGYGSGGSSACVISGRLAAISAVQTLLHLGSIALVFLAIRRRFKMD
jgi:hypothetical protein